MDNNIEDESLIK